MATAKASQPTKASLEKEILMKDLELKKQELVLKKLEIEELRKENSEWRERELSNTSAELQIKKVYALLAFLDTEVLVEDTKDTVNVLNPNEIVKVKKKILTIIDKF